MYRREEATPEARGVSRFSAASILRASSPGRHPKVDPDKKTDHGFGIKDWC